MGAFVDDVVSAGTSQRSKKANPVAITAACLILLGQDPESYAKACWALAKATTELQVEGIKVQTLIITGDEDKVSPPALCEKYSAKIADSKVVVLKDVGHWHVFEDVEGVATAVKDFL